MIETAAGIENLTLNVTQEIHVKASLDATFAALVEQLGKGNETPGGPMPMKIEPWPGGRWYRDLGDDNGHFWGHVQAIKRPTLLEIHRAAVHVLSARLERAVSPERRKWRNADQVPSRRARIHHGRTQAGCRDRLDEHARSCPQARAEGARLERSRCGRKAKEARLCVQYAWRPRHCWRAA